MRPGNENQADGWKTGKTGRRNKKKVLGIPAYVYDLDFEAHEHYSEELKETEENCMLLESGDFKSDSNS